MPKPQPAPGFVAGCARAGCVSAVPPSVGPAAAFPLVASAARLSSPLASRSSAIRGSSSSTLSSRTVLRRRESQATFTAKRFQATRGGSASTAGGGAAPGGNGARTATSSSTTTPRRSPRSTSPIATRACRSFAAREARTARRTAGSAARSTSRIPSATSQRRRRRVIPPPGYAPARPASTSPVAIVGTAEPARRAARTTAGRGRLASAGPRDALIGAPGSRLPLRLRVPPEVVLAFSVGVEGDGREDRHAAGVRFRVLVDGVERFARVVNPAARRGDRVWFDEQVDLSGEAGRAVEIVFATDVAGPGTPAGTPGWSGVRVVERHWRSRQPADPSTPNVLVLLVHTPRADRLGCYAAVPTPSPTLDALAARGALFEQNVAHAPWTMPSTASILTGLYPTAHGVLGDRGQTLRDDLVTLAEAAEEHGITTVAVSTNPLVSRGTNFSQGFETFVELDIETGREGGEVV